MISFSQAADILACKPHTLAQLIEVGDVVPSSITREQVISGPFWGADFIESITFTPDDIERFRVEIRRRRFEDFKSEYADVLRPYTGQGGRGLECSPGWTDILETYCDQLRAWHSRGWPLKLVWGKEKFGSLRLFTDWAPNSLTSLQWHWLCASNELARRKSLTVCDQCGEPGRARWGHHVETLCDRHAHLVGGLRPEDGIILDLDREHLSKDGQLLQRPSRFTLKNLEDMFNDEADIRTKTALEYDPFLEAGALIAWDRVHELRRKLLEVDAVIGNLKIDFKLQRFDFDAVEYKITVDPDLPNWLERPAISDDQLEEIKGRIDGIMKGTNE